MNKSQSELYLDFRIEMCEKIQNLAVKRATKMTQTEMAQKLNVSLKTIQRFESYRSFDSYLFWGYREISQ